MVQKHRHAMSPEWLLLLLPHLAFSGARATSRNCWGYLEVTIVGTVGAFLPQEAAGAVGGCGGVAGARLVGIATDEARESFLPTGARDQFHPVGLAERRGGSRDGSRGSRGGSSEGGTLGGPGRRNWGGRSGAFISRDGSERAWRFGAEDNLALLHVGVEKKKKSWGDEEIFLLLFATSSRRGTEVVLPPTAPAP